MLSIFPSLLSYEQFGPFLIRLILGATLAYMGYLRIRNHEEKKYLYCNATICGAIEILAAIFLILGLFTQGAAILGAITLIIRLGYKIQEKAFLTNGVNYYLILLVLTISLLFMGAGVFAFDLPL